MIEAILVGVIGDGFGMGGVAVVVGVYDML
jgi:hypothetical protein